MNPQYTQKIKILALRASLLAAGVILLIAGHDEVAVGIFISLFAFIALF